jgi:hypothetical protein
MTISTTTALLLTVQERVALSTALKTTLRLWGDSEDQAQERIRVKLQAVVKKLDANPAQRRRRANVVESERASGMENAWPNRGHWAKPTVSTEGQGHRL